MSEMEESVPQGVPVEQARPRVEDTPEFQTLTQEQQEKLLAMRERLTAEASAPEMVISRSINEMGFWEGLWHTAKPHMEKRKQIYFKSLKANAALALSVIPLLGEGVSLGKGLLGVARVEGKMKFIPAIRGATAIKETIKTPSRVWQAGKTFQNAEIFAKRNIFTKGAEGVIKAGELVTRPIRVGWETFKAPMDSLGRQHVMHAHEVTAKILQGNVVNDYREKIDLAKKGAEVGKLYKDIKAAKKKGIDLHNIEWWNLAKKARLKTSEIKAGFEGRKAAKVVSKAMDAELVGKLLTKNPNANFFAKEAYKASEKLKPNLVKATQMKVIAPFLDRWFNLTPDVPHWVSNTTAVAELAGAHGIDAIPAIIQLGINKYKDFDVTVNMSKDVYKYMKKRIFDPSSERKSAAEVFAAAPVAAT